MMGVQEEACCGGKTFALGAKCPGASRAPQAPELAMEPQMVGPGVGEPRAMSNGTEAVLQQKRRLIRIPEGVVRLIP